MDDVETGADGGRGTGGDGHTGSDASGESGTDAGADAGEGPGATPGPAVPDAARRATAAGPVCDPCLGRLFADRSFGLTNGERGKGLRVTLALADDADYGDLRVDAADCWVCEGHCGRFDEWADRAVAALGDVDFHSYQVGTRAPPLIEENDRLLREEAGLDPDAGESFKSELNREVGKRVGARTDSPVDFERPDVQLLLNVERGDVDVQVNPAFVYGRYRKLERDVPQTEWPCRECGATGTQFAPDAAGDGGGDDGDVEAGDGSDRSDGPEAGGDRSDGPEAGDDRSGPEADCEHCGGTGYIYPTSVEEEIAPHVREAMDGAEAVFHGAGREDVDALMLGTGRPFVVEIKEPRTRRPDLDALEAHVNDAADGRVEVEGLELATHEMVERVKELPASKTYRASVAFDEAVDPGAFEAALDELRGATVEQYTPERVDHRRASRTRTRTVYDIDGDLRAGGDGGGDGDHGAEDDGAGDPGAGDGDPADGAREATVEVHGEGGLYVKELVHGDGGRTEPSLSGLLGVDADVTALDVLAVEAEEGRFADPEYLIGEG